MDRLTELISKLNEQFAQKADPAQLLMTNRLIEAELNRLISAPGKTLGTAKVVVVMPSAPAAHHRFMPPEAPVEEEILEKPVAVESQEPLPKPRESNGWNYDPMIEIPTLSHQKDSRELNEMMASEQSSLNDKLKADVIEVGHLLNDSPVRDLKRAIGINDRFVFINELFRGDETMYERSIKTINGFRIFPEAEYWIERELKVKLGWDDSKEATRHFYQLVKRRFS